MIPPGNRTPPRTNSLRPIPPKHFEVQCLITNVRLLVDIFQRWTFIEGELKEEFPVLAFSHRSQVGICTIPVSVQAREITGVSHIQSDYSTFSADAERGRRLG
jgi:hypothetical protein